MENADHLEDPSDGGGNGVGDAIEQVDEVDYSKMKKAEYGCIWLYTAVYSHIQDIQKVDFCIQIIWFKRYLDEMVLDDMKGTLPLHVCYFRADT